MPFYNCDRCPSYCCSYPRIQVEESDLVRLAKHLGVSYGVARKKFVRRGEEPGELILRHTPDATAALASATGGPAHASQPGAPSGSSFPSSPRVG